MDRLFQPHEKYRKEFKNAFRQDITHLSDLGFDCLSDLPGSCPPANTSAFDHPVGLRMTFYTHRAQVPEGILSPLGPWVYMVNGEKMDPGLPASGTSIPVNLEPLFL